METSDAITTLSALAQPTRLEAFRALVRAAPDGLASGQLAQRLGIPANTLSAHLAILAQAGLVESERHSRSVRYRARLHSLREAITFLLKDCCNGNAEICAPLMADIEPGCSADTCSPVSCE